MKINWFSPLPAARTGIALYTELLIPVLQERAELTLWTDQREWDDRLHQVARVRQFDPQWPPWHEFNQADLSFYNIGNNCQYHKGIWEVSRRHAGIVILHDFCLQHFFAGLYVNERKDSEEYRRIMAHYYGDAGRHAASQFLMHALTIEQLAPTFPLTPLALENALGVVIHNLTGRQALTCQPPLPVVYLPLPFAPSTGSPRTALVCRRRSGPPYGLIAFGVIGPNRRLEQFLSAWAGLSEKAAFRLRICGEIYDAGYINSHIRNLGLSDFAEVCGYVSDEDLHAELMQADLAVNLRYPTMGEASGSQLLIWEHSLPALVTQVGWYATLQKNTVAFVRPECEAEDICAQLRAFLENPECFAEMGRRGYEIVEREHAPDQYAEALLALSGAARGWSLRHSRLSLARRAGDDMRLWITPAASDTLTERAARAVWGISGNVSARKKAGA
jgi:glycosyltransferase involved in cell wall biosynthesis